MILMKKVLIALFAGMLLFASQATAGSRYDDARLVSLLKGAGYQTVEIIEDGKIRIVVNGENYLLINQPDGDLQAYYGIGGVKISCEAINRWNRDHRLSRAYLDSDNDPVIEADLLSNGGISDKNVTEFFKIFLQSVGAYKSFLSENMK